MAEKNEILNGILDSVLTIVESTGTRSSATSASCWTPPAITSSPRQTRRSGFALWRMSTVSPPIDELKESQKEQSAEEIIHYMCTDEVYGYGLDDAALDKTYILKMVNMRYAINLNSFQKYITTTLAFDVSEGDGGGNHGK